MRMTDRVLNLLPQPLHARVVRHREGVKFVIVGGFCYVATVLINYVLKLTVLEERPVTALTIATILTAFLSYVLNREWSFRTRGGRRRHHELGLFVVINAVAIAINSAPLFVARYVFGLAVPAVSLLTQEISDFAFGIVLGTLFAMLFRLWAYRLWVFPEEDVRPAPQRHDRTATPQQGANAEIDAHSRRA